MSLRSSTRRALEVLLAAAVVALVVGAVLGQPILFGFVETGSMEPTLDPGDGFVAVPTLVAGDVEVGDVVVFEARNLQGGGLTTHRVVGETEGGYVTKGDANPFTDQDGPEPPVTEDQIVAKALSVNGWLVSIPYFGVVVLAIRGVVQTTQGTIARAIGMGDAAGSQGTGVFLVTLGIVLFALTAVQESLSGPRRERRRSRSRPGVVDTRKLTAVFLLVVLVPANAAMIVPSTTHDISIDGDVVAEDEAFVPGEPTSWEYSYTNYGAVPLAFEMEATGGNVTVPDEPRVLWRDANATVSVSMPTPPPGERAEGQIREHRYLLVLPAPVIGALHDVHPTLALLAVDATLVAGVLLVSGRILGFGPLRLRWGSGVSLRTRLRRKFG
ncbi:signal peptidase I [Halosimplex salinum]|uniref:signal peptidase I n=1 Tax=Halosimplex salinum TaxID=1710538 RepID=UPI000F477FAC|nr:signal peptidase I [Halosimplex salinum]